MSALDLKEEINALVSTSMWYKNDKNLFFIATSANTSMKYHKPNELLDHFTDAEWSRNEMHRTIDLEISTPIEKDQSVNPKDNLSVLTWIRYLLELLFDRSFRYQGWN